MNEIQGCMPYALMETPGFTYFNHSNMIDFDSTMKIHC